MADVDESGACDKYSKRIEILESKLKKTGEKMSKKETCWPVHIILGGMTPIIIGILLWFVKPGFVTKKDGNDIVLDYSKVLTWDIGITIVLWAALYGHYYYFGSSSKVCTK